MSVESEKVREELADYAHRTWSGWMNHLFSKSHANGDGTVTIPAEQVVRWRRQMETEYQDLPGEEKLSDGDEADEILGIIGK